MTVSFDTTKKDAQLINKIAERANDVLGTDRTQTAMDVTAVHANGCSLRLDDFLAAPEFDFCHDIFGIQNHLDRKTGQLDGRFLPRHAAPNPRHGA